MATLSQIRAWSTEHLVNAAGYWSKTADEWEEVFLQMRNRSYSLAWHGAGGDGLRQRTTDDLTIVSGKADQLRHAAGIARTGASDIGAAQRRVLYAAEDAQSAGFTVGEDLSVTDIRSSTPAQQAARQAQAQAFAGDIHLRAEQLEGADAKVAGQLAAATADLGTVGFSPAAHGNGIKLVDFKQGGGAETPPPFAPWDTADGTPRPGGSDSYPDPIASMTLPPPGTTAPVSDATKQWVDSMVKALASRPPDDPIAVEARRLAYEALHQPCSSAEWTVAVTGFAGSSAGALGTAIAVPAGPADWALLGAALLGVTGSGAAVVNCATK